MSSQEEQQYTLEQVKEIKDKMLAKWEEDIPFLSKRLEYERLTTELEELNMRRVYAQVKVANLIAPQPEEDIVPKHERKLRKETA